MRAPFIILLIILLANLFVDLYIYIQCKRRCNSKSWSKLQKTTSIVLIAVMIVGMALPAKEGNDGMLLTKMWILFSYFTVYIPKYIAVIFDLLASIPRLWNHKRMKWATYAGVLLSIFTFISLWWGAFVNRYRIQVKEVAVEVTGLPKSFDGFKIAQFSDLHTGTFGTDTAFVAKLVNRINSLDADIIVFTGDMVNRQSDEMNPFISVLSRLYAPGGTYAILGNHDYGDYKNWPDNESKHKNMEDLYAGYKNAGITLLRNDCRWIRNGVDSIALIGVENIGDPPFKTYGSLTKSYPDLSDAASKILLTHNPQHWVDSIAGHSDKNIPLTLSGHTHAMQIEVGGFSPGKFRYPTWGGLYSDENGSHSLYVNIGAGTVGVPMRLGATPEITLITLRPKHD